MKVTKMQYADAMKDTICILALGLDIRDETSYLNEIEVRLHPPEGFDTFVRKNDFFGKNVDVIAGLQKDEKGEFQFDKFQAIRIRLDK